MSEAAVASPHHLSTEAGIQILERGGNAVDAAIAVVAAQGVVAPETCGLGGDLFALVHQPEWDRPLALNASGRSGSGADLDILTTSGHKSVPADDPHTVTIPGCVDGLVELSKRLGSLPLAGCVAPAIGLAADGYEVSREQAGAFGRQAPRYRDNPAVSDFYPGGSPVEIGDHVSRPALAATLRMIASGGRKAFYEGPPGEDIANAVGLITAEDLSRLQAEWVEPIGTQVFGLAAWTVPPNSQGYLGPATLRIFERLNPPNDAEDPLWWHLLIESYRSVAWERNDLVADPDHLALPANLLLDDARLERAAATVSPDTAGIWPMATSSPASTAYMCVSDRNGMTVSVIQSNYRGTGSRFGAERSGFLLQDRGMGFNLIPGHANALGPGKRPLHTLSPTLWTSGETPVWALGTRGGAVQPQLVAQLAATAIGQGMALEEAQSRPRWTVPHFGPNASSRVELEPGVHQSVKAGLAKRGHQLEEHGESRPGWGPMSLIHVDGHRRSTARDPRVETTAAAVVSS